MSWIQYLNKYSGFIIFLISIFVIVYFSKGKKNFEDELMIKGNFAIGTFHEFSSSIYYRGSGRSFSYSYKNENEEQVLYSQLSKFPSKDIRKNIFEGDKFLIIYNNKGSIMYFDKPIRDSTDFQRYVCEFEEMRKKQNK